MNTTRSSAGCARTRYAYVGGGATTASMLWQHVRSAVATGMRDITITVYERGDDLGTGLAYGSGALTCHVVNMEAETVSIDPDDHDDFVRWMRARAAELRERYPGLDTSARGFPPRPVVGAYLRERCGEALADAARAGIAVRVVRAEVTDIEPTPDGLRVIASDGSAELADRVVLASGHWEAAFGRECEALGARLAAQGRGGYFFPWPAARLRAAVPPAATVALIGTSLTAIDAAFTLLDDGGSYVPGPGGTLAFEPAPGCRWVTMHSRHGLLPKVRSLWPAPEHDAPFLTAATVDELTGDGLHPPRFDDVLEAFRRRVEWAAGVPFDAAALARLLDGLPGGNVTERVRATLACDLARASRPDPAWNRLHYAIRNAYPALARLYPRFDRADRERFDATFLRAFIGYAAAMPAQNAAKLGALLAAGRVRVSAGMAGVRADEREGCFELDTRHADGRVTVTRARYLVNAIGQTRQLDLERAPLWRNLVRRGLATLHASGAVRVDFEGSNLIEPSGRRSDALFAVGAMTLGERVRSSELAASTSFGRAVVLRFTEEAGRRGTCSGGRLT